MRVKRGFKARQFRKKILKRAKGFLLGPIAVVFFCRYRKSDRALAYQYRDRRTKKRQFRRLWIQRINGAARLNGSSYSQLICALNKKGLDINRKMLAELAVSDSQAFLKLLNKLFKGYFLWETSNTLFESC